MQIFQLYQRPVLVTRESAHAIREALTESQESPGRIVLDFAGVEALTPSFFDELVGEIVVAFARQPGLKVTLSNFPIHLSSKYEAVARGRQVKITEPAPGHWEITE